jgi:putative transposase
MPRNKRDEEAGGIYHVWARGNRRADIFVDDEDREHYLATFGHVAIEFGWKPLAYCLMTNHVHHIIELTKPTLGMGMKWAHGTYARWFNERHATGGGHLFERRYGSKRLLSDGAVMYVGCYTLLNPVRASMVQAAHDYPWSSCAATFEQATPPPWLHADRLVARFGTTQTLLDVLASVRVLGAAGFKP